MDRPGADLWHTIDMIADRLGANPVALQVPIGVESEFAGVVDLVSQEAFLYADELGVQQEVREVPPHLREEVARHREILVERVAETDEGLTLKFLEGKPIEPPELRAALRRATLEGRLVSVLCGAALRNRGVQPLLDAVIYFLPSPLDIPPITGINPKTEKEEVRSADEKEPFAALAFKIVSDPYVGRLAYLRVYSGSLKVGSSVLNSSKGTRERVGRLLRMHANHREEIDMAHAGDIAAVAGLKRTFTGDTLCDRKHPIVLESIRFPEPVISVAIEPRTQVDEDKMSVALARLEEEDPTFDVRIDEDTGQTIISGMGELHLEVLVDRMLREFRVSGKVGKPQVSYRETITRPARVEGRFIRQTGGRGQYGHVWLEIEPLGRGEGFEFEARTKGGVMPKEFIPAVGKGVREAMESGVLAGYPVVDLRVALVDGSYHEVDSSELAFKIAASMALKNGLQEAGPVLLEPIMKLEVIVPEEFTGEVVGDLSARRAQIGGMTPRGDLQVIRAQAPLAQMFGYATALRSMTQGRGTFTMEFDHYDRLPPELAEAITGGIRKRVMA